LDARDYRLLAAGVNGGFFFLKKIGMASASRRGSVSSDNRESFDGVVETPLVSSASGLPPSVTIRSRKSSRPIEQPEAPDSEVSMLRQMVLALQRQHDSLIQTISNTSTKRAERWGFRMTVAHSNSSVTLPSENGKAALGKYVAGISHLPCSGKCVLHRLGQHLKTYHSCTPCIIVR
jgi:hypothetical protein